MNYYLIWVSKGYPQKEEFETKEELEARLIHIQPELDDNDSWVDYIFFGKELELSYKPVLGELADDKKRDD